MAGLRHGVDGAEQLPHRRDESDRGQLASGAQPFMVGPQPGVLRTAVSVGIQSAARRPAWPMGVSPAR